MRHSDHWAVLSKRAVLAFESRYSLRLYELISLRKDLFFKSEETFPLGDLKNRLGVPKGKLAKWDHFKSRALEPAIAEVNHLSGFTVRYEMVKEGRFVIAVRLKWAERRRASARPRTRSCRATGPAGRCAGPGRWTTPKGGGQSNRISPQDRYEIPSLSDVTLPAIS